MSELEDQPHSQTEQIEQSLQDLVDSQELCA
jgi:hypothetical protein